MPWTVTNSFKRGLMKTYGRPPWRVYSDHHDLYPAAKKRRVHVDSESDSNGRGDAESGEAGSNLQSAIRDSTAAFLSSPSRRSSTAHNEGTPDDDLSTPPSSPPPVNLTPPPQNTRKPTFTFLKRKRSFTKDTSNGTPLAEVNSNSVRSSVDPPKKKRKLPKQHTMHQMQIDLGGEVRKTCPSCQMEYIPSNSEDAALHKKFHEMNATGIDLGRAFVKANASRWVYEATRFDEGYVVIVDRKSSPTAKSQASKVLEVVQRELSSPEISSEALWSQIEPPGHLERSGTVEKVDRYKVFLHMKNSRCVGLCLTERIWESQPVEMSSAEENKATQLNGSSISVKQETHPAIVGVSRIWTSESSRGKGIAMDLLDCVVSNFIYGMEIPKDQVAFSQPTESGKRLARLFFGDETWHVYHES